MAQEKDLVFLMALVALGIMIASGLVAFLQWMVVIPVTLVGLIFTIFLLQQNKDEAVHLSEKLEKAVFLITLIFLAVALVVLYQPA
ncbi:MAG: hydrogenase [Euryarchaeota archaeon]|nr:hydrogenase [Euryarchaeota archaeon]MBU4608116.1 hydrogenase [Euryarchaeota archaeon]MBV1729828.1 hydrogenase [Methanobacterium sp.]MBV1755844.1 hydrogenase [Methanobacterium sp.]MBV1767651.1 hydrogenase [Methanobacterium sp.]